MLKLHLRRKPRAPLPLVVPLRPGAAPPAGIAAAGFAGAETETLELFPPAGRTLLAGLGVADGPAAFRAAGAAAAAHWLGLPHIAIDARGLAPAEAAALAEGAALRAWRYEKLRTRAEEDGPRLGALDLIVDDQAAVAPVWAAREAAVRGTLFARDLATEPSDTLTPEAFAERLKGLREYGVEVEILKPKALRAARMGALLAVGGGSANPPRLVCLRWKGTLAQAPVVFVGKGITFDTGGICIKPADRMWEMRSDMAGAAAAAGAMLTLALRRSPAPAAAVLALAENATGAASYRPGDVLATRSGRTVEVVDTDAEGRLVLADALAWAAETLRPRAMIDLATLTGSIVVGLGRHMAGLFASDEALAAAVIAAGAAVDEPVWRMPIAESHRRALDSDIADLRHCVPERMQPDACQAAAFLREFTAGVPWAHLDIAGMDLRDGADARNPAGASGYGARLLDRLVSHAFELR
jgi:leucyl aminopeptidase